MNDFAPILPGMMPRSFFPARTALARDENALAVMLHGGRITTEVVDEEIARLRNEWHPHTADDTLVRYLSEERLPTLDMFDRVHCASRRRARMMPTGCGSTSRGSDWSGSRCGNDRLNVGRVL
jgi:hypothetical protein